MSDPLVERARKMQQKQDPLRARAERVQASSPAPEPDDGGGYQFLDMRTILPDEDQAAPAAVQREDLPPVEMERILRRFESVTGLQAVPPQVETMQRQALPPMLNDAHLGQFEMVPRDAKVVEAEKIAREEEIRSRFHSLYGDDLKLLDTERLDARLDVTEASLMARNLRDDPRKFPFSIPSDELLEIWGREEWGPAAARSFLETVGKEMKRRTDLIADHPASWTASLFRDTTKMMTAGLLDPLALRSDLSDEQKAEAEAGLFQSVEESGLVGRVANIAAQLLAAGVTIGGATQGVRTMLTRAGMAEATAQQIAQMAVMGAHGASMRGMEASRQGADTGEALTEAAKGFGVGAVSGGVAGRLTGKFNTRAGKAFAGATEDAVAHIGTGGRLEDLPEAMIGGAVGGSLEGGRGQFGRGQDIADGAQRSRIADNVFRSQQARLEAQRAREEAQAQVPDGTAARVQAGNQLESPWPRQEGGEVRATEVEPGEFRAQEESIGRGDREALREYTVGGLYDAINSTLRGEPLLDPGLGDPGDLPQILSDAVNRSPAFRRPVLVYRGINTGQVNVSGGRDALVAEFRAQVGEEVSLGGLQSTSLDPVISRRFTSPDEPVMFEILTDRGLPIPRKLNPINEAEVLLGHDWTYRVERVEDTNHGTVISLRHVPDTATPARAESPAVTATARKIARGPEPTPTEVNVADRALDSVRTARRSGEIDSSLVGAWAEAQRTGKPVDRTTLNVGVNPVRAVGAAAELEGAVKRLVIDAPLNLANKAVLRAARAVLDFGPPGGSLREQIRAAADVVKSYVPVYRRGQEFWETMAEYNATRQLGRFDAKAGTRDLARVPETKKRTTPEQQRLAYDYLEKKATAADLEAAGLGSILPNLDYWRDVLDKNSDRLHELGGLSTETHTKRRGSWVKRTFEAVERRKRKEREELGVTGGEAGKRVEDIYRRQDQYDFLDENGRIVETFETKAEAEAWLERTRGTEEAARKEALAEVRDLIEQAQEYEKPIERILTIGTRKEGDEYVVEHQSVTGGRSKNVVERFEDGAEAKEYYDSLVKQKADGKQNEATRKSIARKLKAEALRKRMDIPKPQKLNLRPPLSDAKLDELGMIRDPAVAVPHSIAEQQSRIAVLELFKKLSENERWASKNKSETHTEQLADDPKYGLLRGMYVPKSVKNQIVGVLGGEGKWSRFVGHFLDTMLNQWKFGKTVYRVASQFRNVFGNSIFAELEGTSWFDGGNLKDLSEAFRVYRSKPGDARYETLRFLVKERIASADYLSTEVLDIMEEVMRITDGLSWGEKFNIWMDDRMRRLSKGRVYEALPGADVLAAAYRAGDVIPKMTAFVRRVRSGESPEAAAKAIRKYYPQYDTAITSRLFSRRGAVPAIGRQFMPPFMTFTTEAARIMLIHAAENPVKFAAMIFGLKAAGGALADMAGFTEEDIEKINRASPSYRDVNMLNWLVPMKGPNGEVRSVSWTYTIPMGSEIQTFLDGLFNKEDPLVALDGVSPRDLPLGPYVLLGLQVAANWNLFKGRPINEADGRGGFTAVSEAEGRRQMWRFIFESILPTTMGRDYRVVREAIEGVPVSRDGHVRRDAMLVLADVLLGIKTFEWDPEKDLDFSHSRFEGLIQKKIGGIRSGLRDARNGTPERRDQLVNEAKADILKLANADHLLQTGEVKKYSRFEDLPFVLRSKVNRAMAADPSDRTRKKRRTLLPRQK